MKKIIDFCKEESLFSILLLIVILLSIIYPDKIKQYPLYVEWHTIIALCSLLIITTAIKESEYLSFFGSLFIKKLYTERKLALFLVLLCAVLSTIFTNDIALFIMIPLTLSFQNILKNDLHKLVILEAISANVGSTLTPIGNPQNLFLWHKWKISFISFVVKTLPLVLLSTTILILFIFIFISDKKIKEKTTKDNYPDKNRLLFIISLVLLIFYILCLQMNFHLFALIIVIGIYLLIDKKVFMKIDWIFLLIFIEFFIIFHLISSLPLVKKAILSINLEKSSNIYFLSLALSQIMSNVPAAIFLSKFSNNWYAITYGVNVGGNGILWSSLANIIALKIYKSKKLWIEFHKYSIIYLIVSASATYIIFFT